MARDDSLPQYDNRPGIFVAHEMPDNIKIAPLSDAAFRTLIAAWCYCSRVRTDGLIPMAKWREMGSTSARKELLAPPVMAPEKPALVQEIPGGVRCHDYLSHNRSSAEVQAVSESKSESGTLGAHKRWHVGRRIVAADCEHCQEARKGKRSA